MNYPSHDPQAGPVAQETKPETSTRQSWLRRSGAWVVGLVAAFLAGALFGFSNLSEPEVVVREVEVELEPADLQERREEVAIAQEENELEQNRLTETGSELDAREVDLDEREEAVAQTELDLEENTIPGAGTFRVGEDIEPGTYRNTGGNYCFWARLSGYSGEGTDVIAAGNVEEQGFVTISESDLAFETSSCSDWIKQ